MSHTNRGRAFRAVLPAALATLLCLPAIARAATPSSGTVSGTSAQASWTGGPALPTAGGCGGPANAKCDNYKLSIAPPSYAFKVEIKISLKPADDYDLEVYGPDGALLATSGNAAGQAEAVTLTNPAGGIYTVSVAPYAAAFSYSGSAQLSQLPAAPPPSGETPPRYANYNPPNGMGQNAGEPTLGVNERTGSVMYIAGTETLRVDFDDCSSPATAQDRKSVV